MRRPSALSRSTSSASRAGTVTGDGEAVLFESTAAQTATVITATNNGIETFNNIKSASAPESFSWTVDLTRQQRLVPQADGSVDIVDPTPTAKEMKLAAPRGEPDVIAPADPGDPTTSQPPTAAQRESAPTVDGNYQVPAASAIGDPPAADNLGGAPPSSTTAAQQSLTSALDDGASAVAAQAQRPARGRAPNRRPMSSRQAARSLLRRFVSPPSASQQPSRRRRRPTPPVPTYRARWAKPRRPSSARPWSSWARITPLDGRASRALVGSSVSVGGGRCECSAVTAAPFCESGAARRCARRSWS